ncbi:MAG: 1,4-alpha-glucan branching enzyme GlgB, partial [Parcubacteria group bacterium GW2011_GWF2_46_8]
MITTIPIDDGIQIINSNHRNPASVLGMHIIESDENTFISVRAFLSDASEMFVVDNSDPEKIYKMKKVHKSGLFEAIITDRHERFKYKFKIKDYFNNEHFVNDSYSFWTQNMTDFDKYLFNRAQHYRIYDKMGAHIIEKDGVKGAQFAVWAPNAARVSVIGGFNNWDGRRHQMIISEDSGIWQLFIPELVEGDIYKYEIKTREGYILQKADPYAFYGELRPATASIIWDIDKYKWNDEN